MRQLPADLSPIYMMRNTAIQINEEGQRDESDTLGEDGLDSLL